MQRLASAPLTALALAAALTAARPAAAEEPLRAVALEALRGRIETQGAYDIGPEGLVVPVDGNVPLVLPFGAELLELDVDASGPVLLTWAARTTGVPFRPFGPPWRHLTLPRQRRTVGLDLRIAEGWSMQAQAVLVLTGVGRVVIHGMRVSPVPRDRDEAAADLDQARRWAPESPGHTTINLLSPAFWRASTGFWMTDAMALAAAAAFAVAVGVSWIRRRRAGLGAALAVSALVAGGLAGAQLLVRFLPAFHLRPTLDVEARIRDNYDIAPDLGALAALARATLRPDERVGVLAGPGHWFAPQTICFNLAPRPCVLMSAGASQPEYRGISRVGRLRAGELDAVVAYRAAALPEGFFPVAALGKSAVIARRRP